MQLNAIGEMAEKYWNQIPQHFPFVKLGKFVVMPNHMYDGVDINVSQNVNQYHIHF